MSVVFAIVTPHPLDSVLAKIERANEHVKELDVHLSGGDKRTAHVMRLCREPHPNTHVLTVGDLPPKDPHRIPILIGETLYQLRSSLDHLVGQLERANGCGRVKGFEFPVYWDTGKYKTEARGKTKGVSATAQAKIEVLQPYHRRGSGAYRDHPLWILHDLNNTDKHRVLISVTPSIRIDDFNLQAGLPGVPVEWPMSVAPEHRANPDTAKLDVNVNGKFTLNITFAEFGTIQNEPVIPGLQQLYDFVRGLSGTSSRSSPRPHVFGARYSRKFRVNQRARGPFSAPAAEHLGFIDTTPRGV